MRTDPNPLYKGPSPPWPRWAVIAWIVVMVAIETWLLIDGAYMKAAIVGALAILAVVFELRRRF